MSCSCDGKFYCRLTPGPRGPQGPTGSNGSGTGVYGALNNYSGYTQPVNSSFVKIGTGWNAGPSSGTVVDNANGVISILSSGTYSISADACGVANTDSIPVVIGVFVDGVEKPTMESDTVAQSNTGWLCAMSALHSFPASANVDLRIRSTGGSFSLVVASAHLNAVKV